MSLVGLLSQEGPREALWWATALSALSLLYIQRSRPPLRVTWSLRRAHWVQVCMHSAVFLYWGFYDPLVIKVAPLILAQLPFAYLLDMLLAWTRGRAWQIGLGPVPIIGSLNLFLWFRAEHFHWQLVMVALAFIGRECLRWREEGRGHIFNPSALALTVTSVALICTDSSVSHTWGQEISTQLSLGPHMFELIFGLGLIVQLAFGVGWVTLSAALTLWGLGALWTAWSGEWFFTDTAIPISVFLGMNLLITDPRTSPHHPLGKLMFGALYGACVMPIFLLMISLGQPAFFDKLLQVPLCNLLAPRLDRWGLYVSKRLTRAWGRLAQLFRATSQRGTVGLWALCFIALRPSLVAHPGLSVETWEGPCESGEPYACRGLWHSLERGCGLRDDERCYMLAARLADPEALNRNLERAMSLLTVSCEREHQESCALMRRLLLTVQPSPAPLEPSPKEPPASLLGEGACAQGDGVSCLQEAGQLIQSGAAAQEIAARFTRACELGLAPGCANLGLMHLQGKLERSSAEVARLYHIKACELGLAKACGRLAVLYARGIGGPPDLEAAQRASRQACEGGDQASCLALSD